MKEPIVKRPRVQVRTHIFKVVFWLAIAIAPTSVAAGDLYALVIGIDRYSTLSDLKGATNDAKDVAQTLEAIGARKVTLITDEDATREAIFSAWRALTERAGENDTLIFHYAGHGARQPAILDGHEAFDNMFLLSGFNETGPGVNERLIDNEIGHLLAEEAEATVVFVADSCFAGGMTRDIDPSLPANSRVAQVSLDPSEDLIPQRVEALGEVSEKALERVVWLYAQDQNKVTQEYRIKDQVRGALSYAFSRALEGAADKDKNSVLSTAELKRYINRTVKRYSERRQRPEVNAGSRGLSIPIPTAFGGGTEPVSTGLPGLSLYRTPDFRLPQLIGVKEVADKTRADLILDGEAGWLYNRAGDRVTRISDEMSAAALQGAIDKWRFLAFLAELKSTEDPDVSLRDGSRVYKAGERVTFQMVSGSHKNILLFNLAATGKIQLVAPVRSGGRGLAAGKLRLERTERFTSQVVPPLGADHLIALSSPTPMPGLVSLIKLANGTADLENLAKDFRVLLDGQQFGLDWVGLYTREKDETP
ncbi:caspase family protein [uncultured Roseibium sp.]|uniref:caspase family protein n=1 Tax=uncultured Roseibium sp. TaxID=1936171 RepID=UPI0026251BD5|nr:caspase family protein [uncultured Roseibium sp.]